MPRSHPSVDCLQEWEDFLAELEEEEGRVSNHLGFLDNAAPQAKGVGAVAKPLAGVANTVAQATVAAPLSTTLVELGQVGSLGTASLAVNPVTTPVAAVLMMVEVGLSARSAVKTYRHIKNIEMIMERYDQEMSVDTRFALWYVCDKKNKKLKRKGIGCIPVLGSIANSVYSGGRSIYKRARGTRGKNRRANAEVLWGEHLRGDRAASESCRELLGHEIFSKIQDCHDGHLVLKKKLRSI